MNSATPVQKLWNYCNVLRVEVSKRIKEEFENGRDYYRHHGAPLAVLPDPADDRPSAEFLRWHNEHRFFG